MQLKSRLLLIPLGQLKSKKSTFVDAVRATKKSTFYAFCAPKKSTFVDAFCAPKKSTFVDAFCAPKKSTFVDAFCAPKKSTFVDAQLKSKLWDCRLERCFLPIEKKYCCGFFFLRQKEIQMLPA